MSILAREQLVDQLAFTADSQRSDLLDPELTQTQLIALLLDVSSAAQGWSCKLKLTSVRSDHRDDSSLGLHCHARGYCADLWPVDANGSWLSAEDPRFQAILGAGAASSWLHQWGLAGTAWTPANEAAAGPTAFQDEGADHLHLGAQ